MIYLIGGTARVGKSHLAKLIVKNKHIPFFPTDALIQTLKDLTPQLGIADRLPYPELGERFYPYLERLIYHLNLRLDDYLIEGEVILPRFIPKLAQKFSIKAVFLGNSQITLPQLLKYPGKNNWVAKLNKKDQAILAPWIKQSTEFFEKDCLKHHQTYFDLGQNYHQTLKQAYEELAA